MFVLETQGHAVTADLHVPFLATLSKLLGGPLHVLVQFLDGVIMSPLNHDVVQVPVILHVGIAQGPSSVSDI